MVVTNQAGFSQLLPFPSRQTTTATFYDWIPVVVLKALSMHAHFAPPSEGCESLRRIRAGIFQIHSPKSIGVKRRSQKNGRSDISELAHIQQIHFLSASIVIELQCGCHVTAGGLTFVSLASRYQPYQLS